MEKAKEKTVEYFTHDYHARDDLQEILQVLGHEAKSIYWDLVEMLYENGGYLEISKISTYAFSLHTNSEMITQLISERFGLFSSNDEFFWSESALKRLNVRMEIAKERSKAGQAGALKRWNKKNNKPAPAQKEKVVYKVFPETKYIKITEQEYEKSVKKWGEDKTLKMVDILENWLENGTKTAKQVRNNPHYGYFRKDGWLSTRADEELKKEVTRNEINSEYGKY